MKTILWVQAKDTDSSDLFVIDGVFSEYHSSEEQKAAYSELVSTSRWHEVTSHRSYDYNGLRFFVKKHDQRKVFSHFVEKDIADRPVLYLFQSQDSSVNAFIDSLTESMAKLPEKYSSSEKEAFVHLDNVFRRKVKIGFFLIFLFVVLLILVLVIVL